MKLRLNAGQARTSRRLIVPAIGAAFIGGALVATALTGASAAGNMVPRLVPHRLRPRSARGITPTTPACTVHLVGGPPPTQNYDVCITSHGNVNGFQWGDGTVPGTPVSYLDNEGYCVARDFESTGVDYYDAGSAGKAGFGAATASMGSPKTYSVTRTTLDGKLTVTQNFFLKPATSQLFIGVIVKNNDSVSHTLIVERYFHPNISSDGGSTLNWTGLKGAESISADNSNVASHYRGIQLAVTSRNVVSGPSGFDTGGGRVDAPTFTSTYKSSCAATSGASAASPGDNYGGVFGATLPGSSPPVAPGGTLTFQFVYRIY